MHVKFCSKTHVYTFHIITATLITTLIISFNRGHQLFGIFFIYLISNASHGKVRFETLLYLYCKVYDDIVQKVPPLKGS